MLKHFGLPPGTRPASPEAYLGTQTLHQWFVIRQSPRYHRVSRCSMTPPIPKEGAALQFCLFSTGPPEGIPISGALWGTGIAPNWPSIQLVAVAGQPQGALEPSNRVMAPRPLEGQGITRSRGAAPDDAEGKPYLHTISFFCTSVPGRKAGRGGRGETETFCAHCTVHTAASSPEPRSPLEMTEMEWWLRARKSWDSED